MELFLHTSLLTFRIKKNILYYLMYHTMYLLIIQTIEGNDPTVS